MERTFKYLEFVGLEADLSDIRERFEGQAVVELVWEAEHLAGSALGFFSGAYPIEAPYFWWGESRVLPWHADYWKGFKGGSLYPAIPSDEVDAIASKILELSAARAKDSIKYEQMTYLSDDLCASQKLKIQGLAVEVCLCIDQFLELLLNGDGLEAVSWLTAAYRNVIEATVQSQLALGIGSEAVRANALAAAKARHREHHAMKVQVFQWCAEHLGSYPSMDAAAEAVTGTKKLVPIAFRTARAWIGDFRKQQQSARKR